MQKKYICQICSKEFFDEVKRNRKVCSKECMKKIIGIKNKKRMYSLWQNLEYRKRMSDAHKGYIPTPEQRKKISNGNKGKTMSEEAKRKISISHLGSKNPMFGKKSTRPRKEVKIKNGYILIYNLNHPKKDSQGYIKRSRLVMEKHLRRYLNSEERIHHKGTQYPIGSIANKQDDRIENLKLFANESEHQKFHKPKGCLIGANAIIHT